MNLFMWLATSVGIITMPTHSHVCVHTHTQTHRHTVFLHTYFMLIIIPTASPVMVLLKWKAFDFCIWSSIHKESHFKAQKIFLGLSTYLIFLVMCVICHVLPVLDFIWLDTGDVIGGSSTSVSLSRFFPCQIWKFRYLIILFLLLKIFLPFSCFPVGCSFILIFITEKNYCVFI